MTINTICGRCRSELTIDDASELASETALKLWFERHRTCTPWDGGIEIVGSRPATPDERRALLATPHQWLVSGGDMSTTRDCWCPIGSDHTGEPRA